MDKWWEPFYEDLFCSVQMRDGRWVARREQEATMVPHRLALAPGAKVLDVPCGAGRITMRPLSRSFAELTPRMATLRGFPADSARDGRTRSGHGAALLH